MRRGFLISTLIAGILLGAFSLTGCFATQANLANTDNVDLTGIDNVIIDYDTDNVTVYSTDGDQLVVKEFLGQEGSSYYAAVDTTDSTVTVTQGYRPTTVYWAAYAEVYVPRDYTGSVTVNTGSGQVKIETGNHLDDLDVTTQSGIISISDVTVKSMTVTSNSGGVTLASISGPFNCNTSSGSVSATSLSGYGSITTESGNLSADYKALSGSTTLSTQTGKMTVSLPRTTSYRLSVDTLEGIITLPYSEDQISSQDSTSAEVIFGLSSTTNQVTLSTQSGAINVKIHS